MSLTSLLEDNTDVRERFRQEFTKPKFPAKNALVAPPLTANYVTVGTAFDYLLRFLIQHLNPHTSAKGHWVAEAALKRLADNPKLYAKPTTNAVPEIDAATHTYQTCCACHLCHFTHYRESMVSLSGSYAAVSIGNAGR
jgi:hypothetical protein